MNIKAILKGDGLKWNWMMDWKKEKYEEKIRLKYEVTTYFYYLVKTENKEVESKN